jgi:hypothetical protein
MESGDIIYFILLVFFMILGFFKESRKKKQQRQQRLEEESRPFVDEERDERRWREEYRTVPPPAPAVPAEQGVHREFRSSADLVSIHVEQSPQSSYAFDYDANSFYEKDPGFSGREEAEKPSARSWIGEPGSGMHDDLKKGLIYGEIIQKKY